ncbi:MAG: helix-turn-helix domain-containing protein [Bacteroidota bacterium]
MVLGCRKYRYKLASKLIAHNPKTNGLLRLVVETKDFHNQFNPVPEHQLLTIAWNRGPTQVVYTDNEQHEFPNNSVLALMINQDFRFERPETVVAWQFNRQFYCIIDHDQEVSCVGLLFYGSAGFPAIQLDKEEVRKIDLLYQVFLDEFEDRDNLQEDMLRMLLKRLIIKITRLYKKQTDIQRIPAEELDIVRQFNLLIEKHYKKWHQVQDYAAEMNKSPKTLSNLFAQYNAKSPLKVLHERIILEAKKMLLYTDFSVKEIAFELGFQEVPPFNRLFKKMTSLSPSKFRKAVKVYQ